VLVDALDESVPGRTTLVRRLWGFISDVERLVNDRLVQESEDSLKNAIQECDLKKSQKALAKFKLILEEAKVAHWRERTAEWERSVGILESTQASDKQLQALNKLLEKADKLAFQENWKKAITAYQDCMFWLSRNSCPRKAQLQSETEAKLNAVKSKLVGT